MSNYERKVTNALVDAMQKSIDDQLYAWLNRDKNDNTGLGQIEPLIEFFTPGWSDFKCPTCGEKMWRGRTGTLECLHCDK